jgi:hypothetical protein
MSSPTKGSPESLSKKGLRPLRGDDKRTKPNILTEIHSIRTKSGSFDIVLAKKNPTPVLSSTPRLPTKNWYNDKRPIGSDPFGVNLVSSLKTWTKSEFTYQPKNIIVWIAGSEIYF